MNNFTCYLPQISYAPGAPNVSQQHAVHNTINLPVCQHRRFTKDFLLFVIKYGPFIDLLLKVFRKKKKKPRTYF